jgi:hypothetical protein
MYRLAEGKTTKHNGLLVLPEKEKMERSCSLHPSIDMLLTVVLALAQQPIVYACCPELAHRLVALLLTLSTLLLCSQSE